MCLFPKIIENRKYKPNKKNKGIVPKCKDERTRFVPIPCGNCMECRKQKSRNWQVRLLEDIKVNTNAHFVTLTFNEESLTKLTLEVEKSKKYHKKEVNTVATIAIRRFLESCRYKYGNSVRHWLITELGHKGTERIHIHGLIWTDNPNLIKETWEYGFADTGKYVNQSTITYIVKYVTKTDTQHKDFNPKIFTSAGIGKNYLKNSNYRNNKFSNNQFKDYYTNPQGYKMSLPTYYKNHLFNDEEREKIWIEKMNKNIQFICGEKFDISKSTKSYDRALEHYRLINKQLGYGDDTKDPEIEITRKARLRNNKRKPKKTK